MRKVNYLVFDFLNRFARVILNKVKELSFYESKIILRTTKVPHLLKGKFRDDIWFWLKFIFLSVVQVSSWTKWRNFVLWRGICFSRSSPREWLVSFVLKQKAPKVQEMTPQKNRGRLCFHRTGQNTWPAVLSSHRAGIVVHFVFILFSKNLTGY